MAAGRGRGGERAQAPAQAAGADVVQLERKGNTFILSAARFGDPFTAVAVADLDLGGELLAGLFADGAAEATCPAKSTRTTTQQRGASICAPCRWMAGRRRVVAYLYGGQGTLIVPSWSPDGRRIAFVSNTVPIG